MAEGGNPTPTDPPHDSPAEVPLTRADIPELVKALVAAAGKTTETAKSPDELPFIVLVRAIPPPPLPSEKWLSRCAQTN